MYYEQGAPQPGTCLKCGNNQNLYDLGVEVYEGNALLCKRCITDLATFIGWADKALTDSELVSRETSIKNLEAELAKVPTAAEELINGVRNLVTNFVFDISSSNDSGGQEPVQESGTSSKRPNKTSKTADGHNQASE